VGSGLTHATHGTLGQPTVHPCLVLGLLGAGRAHGGDHRAASLAVSAGANVEAVQRMLGHASAAVTLDVYSGLFDDDLDAVADRMDEAFARNLADFSRTEADAVALSATRQGV
jgi:integrase